MGKGADECARKRRGPSKSVMLDVQQLEKKLANWPADDTCNQADEKCAENGMRVAVKNGFVLNDANKRLDVHEQL